MVAAAQFWAALALMDGQELLKLADYATAHMTVLKTLTINHVSTHAVVVVVVAGAIAHALAATAAQAEEKKDSGEESIITARTCTSELTVPDWRITPMELRERLVHSVHMAEIVGMQTI